MYLSEDNISFILLGLITYFSFHLQLLARLCKAILLLTKMENI